MLAGVRGLHVGLALCACALGCEARETTLIVQVRTDLAPGRDFAEVRVTPDFAAPIHTAAGAGREWGSGVRVAELAGLAVDAVGLEVAALDAAGDVVVARPVRARLEGGVRVVTVLLTRDCSGVVCPGAADLPEATACLAGRCVPDECVAEHEDACGPAECEGAAECTGASACATAECVAGACFTSPDHEACATDQVCDAAAGCVPTTSSGPLRPRGGGHVLLSVERDDAESRVVRVALDGSGAVEDVSAVVSAALGRPDTGLFDSNAGVSPDGRWIVLVDAEYALVRLDVDGIAPTQHVLRGSVYAELAGTAISDAGDLLVYVDGTARGWGLFPITYEGASFRAPGRELTEASPYPFNAQPRWRGGELVFLCAGDAFYGAGVCTIPAEGGPLVELHPPPAGVDVYVSGPGVEASGDLLVAMTESRGSIAQVYRIPAAGGAATPITEPAYLADPCALPDGRWVVVERGPPAVLRVMRADAIVDAIVPADALPPGISRVYLTGCSP